MVAGQDKILLLDHGSSAPLPTEAAAVAAASRFGAGHAEEICAERMWENDGSK